MVLKFVRPPSAKRILPCKMEAVRKWKEEIRVKDIFQLPNTAAKDLFNFRNSLAGAIVLHD